MFKTALFFALSVFIGTAAAHPRVVVVLNPYCCGGYAYYDTGPEAFRRSQIDAQVALHRPQRDAAIAVRRSQDDGLRAYCRSVPSACRQR